MKQMEIGENEAGQRMDKYLKKLLPYAESSFIYKMLRKKNIVWNGKKAEGSIHLAAGDIVTLYLSDETFKKFSGDKTFRIPSENKRKRFPNLQVLYEDADILIVNKPAGILSQKAVPSDVSANEWMIQYLLDTGAVTQQALKTFHPSVCNRLDRNTSGILIAGKTLHGLQKMSAQLKERSLKKYYRCIVSGILTKEQHLKGFLYKDTNKNKVEIYQIKDLNKKDSDKRDLDKKDLNKNRRNLHKDIQYIETEYRPLGYGKDYTMLEVHLITGRSHQIRAHLASIGHPIAGDPKYGDREWNQKYCSKIGLNYQLLHAYRVILENGQEVVAPLPEQFSLFKIENKIENL